MICKYMKGFKEEMNSGSLGTWVCLLWIFFSVENMFKAQDTHGNCSRTLIRDYSIL